MQRSIALIPAPKLGDGILFLIIANNLQRNGYKVTYYNDFIADLQDWLPNITVNPFPKADIDSEFAQFDLTIAHSNSTIIDLAAPDQYKELARQYVFITTARKINPALVFVPASQKEQGLLALAQASGSCIANFGANVPLAERIANFCQQKLGLRDVVNSCGFTPPTSLSQRKYSRRIIIHPTSGKEHKNWLAARFIKLATRLKNESWEPVFCVAPAERPLWLAQVKGAFAVPLFTTISELAAFAYESGFMIGNASGIGHLASALGVPTLTIMNSADHFYWRPGWGRTATVTPPFKLPKLHHNYWRYIVSVSRVIKAFKQLAK
ncbi:MAG: hypothetical protein KAT71_01170 [Gammaproteobacteria bacterium]|nr:hypothetical protein [Gammaproteobacteria bacterium]